MSDIIDAEVEQIPAATFNEPEIVAMTQPHGKLRGLTVQQYLAYVARVSNPSNQTNHLTAPRLLRYLVKHKHWSPFETVVLTQEIVTTRDIGRQILRHRSFSFQEFSQRYADPTRTFDKFIVRDARLQDTKNRQNSIETNDENLIDMWEVKQLQVQREALATYDWALQNNIAKEVARAVLPEGMTLSRLYMTGSLRSWLHYAMVRAGEDTQLEHRIIAQRAWANVVQEFDALKEVKMLADSEEPATGTA
jgi:thymidylate synthase (FAD)